MNLLCVATFLVSLQPAFSNPDLIAPQLQVEQGVLRGQYLLSAKGRLFSAFTGIPYALPPVGDLRFEVAQPAWQWEGIMNATLLHPICPQTNLPAGDYTVRGDEDCLYLNVYTPLVAQSEENYPVMVFFHGGSFVSGDANRDSYDPTIFLDKDIVLVVPNYRLGPLGFLSSEDEALPGNNGLKDQNLAIKWVSANVKSFGGDPERITVFGQSAGGASAHFHMLSPLSKDFIKGVIAESGNALSPWALAPPGQARRNFLRLALALNCSRESTAATVECLKKADAYEITREQDRFYEWTWHPLTPFKPVVEPAFGGSFLVEHPVDVIKKGSAASVPLLTGINTEDGSSESAAIFGNPTLFQEFEKCFTKFAPITLLYDETSADIQGVTNIVNQFYLKGEGITNNSRPQVTDMVTDGVCLNPTNNAIRLHVKYGKAPVFNYAFGYRGSVSFTSVLGDPSYDYGVCHGDELIYLFPMPKVFPQYTPSLSDQVVSELLTTLWANFAARGNPTPAEGTVQWKPVQGEELAYLLINNDTTMEMRQRLYWDRAELWKNLPVHIHYDL